MKVIGKKIKWVDKGYIIIQMDQCTREHGDKINQMGREPMNSQMVLYIKANGRITNYMELGFLSIM